MNQSIKWQFFPQTRAELLIASARFLLASCSLFAIWLDPSEPSRYAELAYLIMSIYVVYSMALAVIAWRVNYPMKLFGFCTHAVDIGLFTIFIFFTEGPTSPFFVYFLFAVLCATIRWKWRGAVHTSAIALIAFICLGLYTRYSDHSNSFELNTFIVRIIYLMIMGLLLSHAAAYLNHLWNQVLALSEWPDADFHEIEGMTRKVLRQACRAMSACGAIAVWEEPEEPWTNSAFYSGGKFEFERKSPDSGNAIIPDALKDKDFLCLKPGLPESTALYASPAGFDYCRQPISISYELLPRTKMNSLICLRLRGELLKGRLFIADKHRLTSDSLVIGRVIADRVSMIMDQFYLLRQLRLAAVNEERFRLARNLHDGLLQSLTGIGLKMKRIRPSNDGPPLTREELLEITELLTFEQRHLRYLIRELRNFEEGLCQTDFSLQVQLNDLCKLIRGYWGVDVQLRTDEFRKTLPAHLENEVYFIVRESLINSAKHSGASKALADLKLKDDRIQIVTGDNGCGFPFHGCYGHSELLSGNLGPSTIMERVASLGGTMVLDSKPYGTTLKIELPLRQKGDADGNSDSPGR